MRAETAELGRLLALDTDDLVLDTVKLAEHEDALVLRLYEAHGGRGTARLTLGIDAASVRRANLLEDAGDELPLADGVVELAYRPFEIITLLVRR
jgi:alpha-mannosidase